MKNLNNDFTLKPPTLPSPMSNSKASLINFICKTNHLIAIMISICLFISPFVITGILMSFQPDIQGEGDIGVAFVKMILMSVSFFTFGFVVLGISLTLFGSNFEYYLPWVKESKGWLDQKYCRDFEILCNSHPELEEYRNKVLNMGRMFLHSEYKMMSRWEIKLKNNTEKIDKMNEKKQQYEDCRSLYKI